MRSPNGEMKWSKISPGSVLNTGSWNRSVGWKNSVVVMGSTDRDIVEDYNHRQVSLVLGSRSDAGTVLLSLTCFFLQNNFAHVAFVDLEAFGIYKPPPQPLSIAAQALGLTTLSQPFLADFEWVCSDGERLGCSRKLLESRWPWFREELEAAESKSRAAIIEAQELRTTTGGDGSDSDDDGLLDPRLRSLPLPTTRTVSRPMSTYNSTSSSTHHRPKSLFPITLRTLDLPLASPAARALLQYFYTLALSTPLQRSISTLSTLLSFVKAYDVIPNLRAVIVHALHESINVQNAPNIYEAAALGGSMALQIRAMQAMLGVSVVFRFDRGVHSVGGMEMADFGCRFVLVDKTTFARG
jgi:hypothetical protein